jgi:hypothetical protein
MWREELWLPAGLSLSAYGSGDLPVISGSDLVTVWTRYASTDIFSASCDWTTKQVHEDNVRLAKVVWDTNIATTVASMSPGTWTLDEANDLLYVWATDSADPDIHTIEVSKRTNCLKETDRNDLSIADLIVQFANGYGLALSQWSATSADITVENVIARYNYEYGIQGWGRNDVIENVVVNTCLAHSNGKAGIGALNYCVDWIIKCSTAYENGTNEEFAETYGIVAFHPTASSVFIQDCSVYNNGIDGSELKGCGIGFDSVGEGCIVRRTQVTNNNRFGIMFEHTTGVEGYLNTVLGHSNKAGMIIARDAHDNKLYHNISSENDIGAEVRGTSPPQSDDMTGNMVADNILAGNATSTLALSNGGENDGVHGYGNIYDHNRVCPIGSF